MTDPTIKKVQPAKLAPDYAKLWFATPETCSDPTNLGPLQEEIFEQLLKLQEMEQLDPKGNNKRQKALAGEQLDEFSDIFAQHRFGVGYNTDLKKS